MHLFLVGSYGDQWGDSEWTFLICLGSMRNQNFDISSVPLHLSTSSGSPDGFSYVSPGSQISHIGWLSWILFDSGAGYLPPSSWKTLGGRLSWNIPGHTHSWYRYWVGLNWKILRNTFPVEKYWWGTAWEETRGYPPSGKVVGRGISWKKPRLFICRRLSGLCWVVR